MLRNFLNREKLNIGSKFILALSLAFFVFVGLLALNSKIQTVKAAGEAIKGLKTTAGEAYLGKNQTISNSSQGVITNIPSAIGKAVGAVLSFVGVIFLILMIYGGFMWMLARGNEQEVTKAKDLIFAAVIGLIIVLSAYAITSYIGLKLI